MERITERRIGTEGEPEVQIHKGFMLSEVLEALAQYEDTGLSPEGIRGLVANADLLMNRNACLEGMVDKMKGFSIPCRPGDVAYEIKSTRKGYMLLKHPVADVSVRGEIFLSSGKKLKADRDSVCFSEEEATSKLMRLMRDPSEKNAGKDDRFYLENLTPDGLRAKEMGTPRKAPGAEAGKAQEEADEVWGPNEPDGDGGDEDITFIS